MIKDSFDKPSNMFQGQVINLTIALYEIPKPGRKIKIIRHKDIFVESNRIKSFKEMSYATYSVKFTAKERTQLEIPENKAIRIIIE